MERFHRRLQERVNDLKRYDIDLDRERKLFERGLVKVLGAPASVSSSHEFDIGRSIQTVRFSEENQVAMRAYSFLRFCEDLGLPFRIRNCVIAVETAASAAEKTVQYSPYWALVTIVRSGDEKLTQKAFDRRVMSQYSIVAADTLIEQLLVALRRVEPYLYEDRGYRIDNFGIQLARVLPEVLSRLCCRCSLAKRDELLGFVLGLYTSESKNSFRGIKNLLSRLLSTYSYEEQYERFAQIVGTPYPEGLSLLGDQEYLNPLYFVAPVDISRSVVTNVHEDQIEKLFELASSEEDTRREWGIFSLVSHYEQGLLDVSCIARLVEVIWKKVDKYGLPRKTGFHRFMFLRKLAPAGVSPTILMKRYILESEFPTQGQSRKTSITAGRNQLCLELIGAGPSLKLSRRELERLFSKLVKWWDADKHHLLDKQSPGFGRHRYEEIRKRLNDLSDILSSVILPRLVTYKNLGQVSSEVHRLMNEFHAHGLPTCKLSVAASFLVGLKKEELTGRLEVALSSSDGAEVVDGLRAVRLVVDSKGILSTSLCAAFLALLGSAIRWRHRPHLSSCLHMAAYVADEHAEQFSGRVQAGCLLGLAELADETALCPQLDEEEFAWRLAVRDAAADLAYRLFLLYKERNVKIPNAVELWRAICDSEKEFADVRCNWGKPNLNDGSAD